VSSLDSRLRGNDDRDECMSDLFDIMINGRSVRVAADETILAAAERAGVRIPTLCYREGHRPLEQCGVCAVEIEGQDALAYACAARVAPGMRVQTESPAVRAARRTALELMLSEHVGDCVGPCELACPAGIRIPVFLRQIREGDQTVALRTLLASVAFPSVLGRVCARYCEHACRRKDVDGAVAICELKCTPGDAFLAGDVGAIVPCAADTGKRVAVVGAGIAGLSAAFYLRQRGHAVSIFDQAGQAGGGLCGVDAKLLPLAILAAEVGRIGNLGALFIFGRSLGRDLALTDLAAEYDAVLVAIGAPVVPGAEAPPRRPPKRQADAAWLVGLGLQATDKGLTVDRETLATSVPRVYAAGAVVRPAASAVQSAAQGRQAADAIHAALAGEALFLLRLVQVRMRGLRAEELALFARSASAAPRRSLPLPAEPANAAAEPAPAAREAAARCLHCDCRARDACVLRDLATACEADPGAYAAARAAFVQDDTHAEVIYEPGKCVKCGRCLAIAEEHAEALGLAYIGRGFQVRVGVPFGEALAAGLTRAASACAEACPTGALALR